MSPVLLEVIHKRMWVLIPTFHPLTTINSGRSAEQRERHVQRGFGHRVPHPEVGGALYGRAPPSGATAAGGNWCRGAAGTACVHGRQAQVRQIDARIFCLAMFRLVDTSLMSLEPLKCNETHVIFVSEKNISFSSETSLACSVDFLLETYLGAHPANVRTRLSKGL